ncbi:MAG: 3'-5' exonuclease [Bacteroidales bacterium]
MNRDELTKEEIQNLPTACFSGEIYTIDKEDKQFTQAIKYLNKQAVLGFDTESRPSFQKGVKNQMALLQLGTKEKVFLFKLRQLGLPHELKAILSSPRIIKSGVAVRDDIRGLKKIGAFEPLGFVELQSMAKKCNLEYLSLRKLAANQLGLRVSKSQRLSDWNRDNYTEGQVNYAATDAWVSLLLFHKLSRFCL